MKPDEKPFMTIKQEKFFQHNLFKQEWINHVVNRRTELRIKHHWTSLLVSHIKSNINN